MAIEEQKNIYDRQWELISSGVISDDLMEEEFNTIICRSYQRRLVTMIECWDKILIKRHHWALKDRLIKPNHNERGLVNKMKFQKGIYQIGRYKDPFRDKANRKMTDILVSITRDWDERLRRAQWSGETTRDPYLWRAEHKTIQDYSFRALKEGDHKELDMWILHWNIDEYFQGPDNKIDVGLIDFENELVSKNKEGSEGPDKSIDIFIEV